jgi:hypothetical protein
MLIFVRGTARRSTSEPHHIHTNLTGQPVTDGNDGSPLSNGASGTFRHAIFDQ